MEYSKEQVLRLKADIKKLVLEQRILKPQRKTDHYKGLRTHPAWQAVAKHQNNRYDLRHMYIAYGFMRGKTIDQIESKRKTEFSQDKVGKLLQTYGEALHTNP